MTFLESKRGYCPICMTEQDLKVVEDKETTVFKGEKISFFERVLCCPVCGECFEDEELQSLNDIRMKDAYREKKGLLRSSDILSIRNKYSISQADLSLLLRWGGKTITRYESHQVQDKAHDMILRKVSEDPGWFIELLAEAKDELPEKTYDRYYEYASKLYENSEDYYVRKLIRAGCSKYLQKPEYCGNSRLSFGKIVDMINYYASSPNVKKLYKVKLMKLMWYGDFLSFKRYGHSITGLPYLALPMGAVPESHDYIIRLKGVPCEVQEEGEKTKYYFHSDEKDYPSLTDEDRSVLDMVIETFGDWNTEKQLVPYMHKERAYKETEENGVISYNYAKDLSLI